MKRGDSALGVPPARLRGGGTSAPAKIAGAGMSLARLATRNSAVVTTAVVMLVLLRPGLAWRWGRRGYLLWRSWRAIIDHESAGRGGSKAR